MKGAPQINATSAKEHVRPVERRIRVVKERARAIKHSLPPKRIPLMMMIAMVLHCTNMLNWFVSKGGISENFSPFTLLTGQTLNFKTHLALEFGEYIVKCMKRKHLETAKRPELKERSALATAATNRADLRFMALDSGRKLTRFAWTNLPMPDIVIKRIKAMAQGQPEDLIFTDRKGRLIADDEIPGVDGDETEDPQNNEPIVESDDLDDENELAAQAIAEAAAAAELAPEPEPEPTILEPAPTAAPEITNNLPDTATPMMAPEPPPAPEEPSNNQPSEAAAEPAVEPVETAGVG